MDIRLTPKMIKEQCGTVSYKRGEAFYKANKVTFQVDEADVCEATVHAAEDFYVVVEKIVGKTFTANCSCPKLENFSLSCQHIAAVLLAIYSKNQMGHDMTANFLTLFERDGKRTSGQQRHFETREVVDIHFTLQPVQVDEMYEWGVALAVAGQPVLDPHKFLRDLAVGAQNTYFNPHTQCFDGASDLVIHALISMTRDGGQVRKNLEVLTITPSVWPQVYSLLSAVPLCSLQVDGRIIERTSRVEEPPPVQFALSEDAESDYRLTVKGFERLKLLPAYNEVLGGGTIYALEPEHNERLLELRQMLAGYASVPIPTAQIDLFFAKVLPKLKKIGHVTLSQKLLEERQQTPLVAKLYLDRLRNRLLASVEFHYAQYVIYPNQQDVHSLIVRDYNKENAILDLMDASGFTKTEGGYFMQNDALEYEFLYNVLPQMESLAQIYATTSVRLRIVKEPAPLRIRVKTQPERINWLEFKFEMDGIADKHIREILAALEMKQKYYRLPSGALMSLQTRELEQIRAFMAAVPSQVEDIETTLNMPITEGLKFLELIEEGGIFEPEQSFLDFTNSLLHPETLTFAVPESLDGILRDYQVHGYQWMKQLAHHGFGGVLADDMGLGKTLQSIAYIMSELDMIRAQKQPVLIVCPSAVTYNWLHECMTFAPELNAVVVDGTSVERIQMLRDLDHVDVVITSYPLLRRDIATYEVRQFHTAFFDEAQAFKNPATQTARTVKKVQAEHKFALTGTPIENALEELWSIYSIVFPHLFGRLEDFSHLTSKDVARRVRPFLLRRMKEQVLGELPAKEETIESTELLPEQKKVYAALLAKLRHDTLKHLDKETFRKNRMRILAGITRLRQVCCHPKLFVEGYTGSSAKYEQLLQILEESRLAGRRVLIFSQFTQMLKIISSELLEQGREHFYLDGSTPSEERVALCNQFNDGEHDVFLISLKAGGTGLNLTGADTVILYDLWWNPAVEEQAEDRAHRMGQQQTVQVIKLIARGTIEEKMYELQHKKRDLIADILQEDGRGAKSLTEQDIREILML